MFGNAGSTVSVPTGITPTSLNAGATINVTGLGGAQSLTYANGAYSAAFPGGFLAAGTYYFNNATGGSDVGPLLAQASVPNPLTWSELVAISTVDRTSALTVHWTGGDPGSYVTVSGLSVGNGASANQYVYGYFTCAAPVSAGAFTVPATVLMSLPKSAVIQGGSSSMLSVSNTTNAQTFTATGIDYGFLEATFEFSKLLFYQ